MSEKCFRHCAVLIVLSVLMTGTKSLKDGYYDTS